MRSYEGIAKNFRFMLVQVSKQVENMLKLLDAPNPRIAKAIQRGDDYIDTQKSQIENACFDFLREKHQDEAMVDFIRAISVITTNLERIGDLAVNVSRQTQYLRDHERLHQFPYQMSGDALLEGVGLVQDALFERDSSRALRICRIEDDLDRLYRAHFQEIIGNLRTGQNVEDWITILFILHYLERMGDALLNIGEAILFTALGERLKVHQYRVLDDAVAATSSMEQSLHDVDVASIWGTRSGVRVGRLEDADEEEGAQRILFKEGNPDKLQKERESLQQWEQIAPGLVPSVVEYQQGGQGAALLLEYIDGATFQDLVLNADRAIVQRAERRIEQTLDRVWTDTRRQESACGRYLGQLRERVDDVYRLHPQLRGREVRIGDLHIPPFEELLAEAEALDSQLVAPFSVFIHGDLNLDNIIYNHETDTLHFVDVHRSRPMDYVQDVSVFLVSNFRLPVFVAPKRRTLEGVALRFLRFARAFAARQSDETFEARLALALVRGFTTSTRFELNHRFAHTMQQRAVLLLNRLLNQPTKDWSTFRVPDSVLVF